LGATSPPLIRHFKKFQENKMCKCTIKQRNFSRNVTGAFASFFERRFPEGVIVPKMLEPYDSVVVSLRDHYQIVFVDVMLL